MNKKQLYETPSAELLVVRFEENFLLSFDEENNTEKLIDDGDEDL